MARDDNTPSLRASHAILASALDSVSEGSLVTDAERRTLFCNRAFTSMTGYSMADLLGRSCRILQGSGTDPDTLDEIRAALDAGTDYRGRILNYRRDGSAFWNQLTISPVRDEFGTISNYVSVQRDMTLEVQRERDLRRQAARDELTGLPLRSNLLATLEESLTRARDSNTQVALGVIDLDEFTSMNHEFGHLVGDTVLREFAARMRSRTRVEDTVSRFGGGRFLLMVQGLDELFGRALLQAIIERLLGAAIEPIDVGEGRAISVSVSYGFSVFPVDGQDIDALLRSAETTVRHAKDRRAAAQGAKAAIG